MTDPNAPKNRLLAYTGLAAAATTFASSHAEAATVVNLGPGTRVYDTTITGIGSISLLSYTSGNAKSAVEFSSLVNIYEFDSTNIILRGDNSTALTTSFEGTRFTYASISDGPPPDYAPVASPKNGAQLNSADNWLFVHATTPEEGGAWIQFYLDGTNTGYLASVVIPDFEGELPSAASAAALVPEPSALMLLSLGATGVLARRKRKVA